MRVPAFDIFIYTYDVDISVIRLYKLFNEGSHGYVCQSFVDTESFWLVFTVQQCLKGGVLKKADDIQCPYFSCTDGRDKELFYTLLANDPKT